MKSKNKKYTSENGAALVTSILALLLATLLGFAMVSIGLSTWEITSNGVEQTEAFYIADSGLTHAVSLINKVKKSQYSAVLTNGANAIPDTGDELSSPPTTGLWATTDNIPAGNNAGGGLTFGKGRYYVSVKNDTATGETPTTDSNGILIITSTGVGRDGARATVEAVVQNETDLLPGLLANGDVKFTGDVQVLGSNGIIQLNGNYDIPGSGKFTCAEQQIQVMTAPIPMPNLKTGSLCSTIPVEGTSIVYNQPRAIPPIIDITRLRTEFRPQADYVFKDDGNIYPQTNGVQRVLPLSGIEKVLLGFNDWAFNSAGVRWGFNGSTRMPDGIFYFENSNTSISKGGDSSNPPKVTVLTEGYIKLNNEIIFQPKLAGYALVSANDIQISTKYGVVGNPGLVYAYGQIKFSTSALIIGSIIAANYYQADGTFLPDQPDPSGGNLLVANQGVIQFSGDVTIVTSNLSNATSVNKISWREVRY